MIVGDRVVHDADYPHPPERVWRALVDASDLSAWLMPTDGFVAEVGSRFTLDARPEMGFIQGEVLEVDEPALLRVRWSGAFGDTVVEFTLTPTETGTHLHLEHTEWEDEAFGRRFDGGWDQKLGRDLPTLLGG